MNYTDGQTRKHRTWLVGVTFVVSLLILSRAYDIVAVSLANSHIISIASCRGLFKKQPLLIAHIPIALAAALAAYTLGHWKSVIGSTIRAAFSWTAISVSGHVLTLIFC